MQWSQIRQAFPDQWLITEAIEAQTIPDQKRQLDQIAVLASCLDGVDTQQQYRVLHQKYPLRELYFVHTSRETLDIRVRNAFARRCLWTTHLKVALTRLVLHERKCATFKGFIY